MLDDAGLLQLVGDDGDGGALLDLEGLFLAQRGGAVDLLVQLQDLEAAERHQRREHQQDQAAKREAAAGFFFLVVVFFLPHGLGAGLFGRFLLFFPGLLGHSGLPRGLLGPLGSGRLHLRHLVGIAAVVTVDPHAKNSL